jgi:hypothetical protein
MASNTYGAILSRVIQPNKDDLRPEAAEALLTLKFGSRDIDRMNALAAKAREGTLTKKEADELEEYMLVGNFLSLLQAKARLALKRRAPVA